MILPPWDEWKEEKITKMLNAKVFYTDGLKPVTGTGFYEANRPTYKTAANLEFNSKVL